MVYSTLDAIRIAEAEPDREVVFFAVGFETTTPADRARRPRRGRKGPREFLRPVQPRHDAPAMRAILEGAGDDEATPVLIDGFIGRRMSAR